MAVSVGLSGLLVVASACTPSGGGLDDAVGPTGSSTSTTADGTGAPGGTTADTGGPGGPSDGDPDDGPTPVPTVTGGSGGQTDGDASEVIPEPSDEVTRLVDLVPEGPTAGRVDDSLPDSASDRLVSAFPADVVLVPEGATVRSSSTSSDGTTAQVTLEARTKGGCGDVLVDYRAWFTGGGFTESSTSETAETAQLSFRRGDDGVTVATTTGADRCDVQVFASLSTKDAG